MVSRAPRLERSELPRGAIIGGRYRVEEQIATGGMGAVYGVFDETRGRPVALKRLLANGDRFVRMFEREFHTLTRLSHPRIIEVYEYGVDDMAPYYTMELLDGQDLRYLAPLPYRQACGFLRDIASSLALLHTRRLLHRDVSPRNVRCTADGHCKLLDFGTMMPFGIPGEVAGTAPFMPPEALRGRALDQRADLYGLGALAYFLLTGRHAYGADQVSALPRCWETPPPVPSLTVSDIPHALDDLVMSLLSLDPLARPVSAAAVIDALVVIGGMAPEDDGAIGQSYFLGSRLVGRAHELDELHRLVERAIAGRGGVAILQGDRGVGKSRLLDEVVALGQTSGAIVARVGCNDEAEPYGLAAALARSVVSSSPREARRAATPFADLKALLPELPASGVLSLSDTPMERRARLQWALTEWLASVARARTVILCVDDLHRADEASAAVLLALARRATELKLLVIATLRPDAATEANAAIAALSTSAETLSLERLDEPQLLELCRSLFGDVTNVERVAHRLFDVTGGNPLACMEAVRELTSSGVLTYADGMWLLPPEIPPGTVAASLDEVMDARVERLGARARQLAQLLSLCGGKKDLPLCRALSSSDEACFAALDELVSEDVILSHEDAYRFSSEAIETALRRSIEPARLAELHRAVGLALAELGAASPAVEVEAGWHLLAGGEAARGAEYLERGATAQFTDGMASAIRALAAALEVYEREGRPLETVIRIKSTLVGAAFPVDRHLDERYGAETLAELLEATGLDIALRLQPKVGTRPGLFAGLAVAALRRLSTPAHRRPPPLREAFALFLPTLGSMLGVASSCLDVQRAEELVKMVEPLRGFGKDHIGSEFYAHACRFLRMVQGREAEAHASSLRFLEQLNEGEGLLAMSEEMRTRWKGGSWICRGQMEVFRDGPGALECAEQLERLGFQFHRAWAHQIRMLYHAMRGEMHLAEPHRHALDVHFLRNGSAWQLEVGPTVSLCAAHGLIGDVTRLKETLEQLDRAAKTIPSLRPYCDLVRMSYRRHRGDFAGALELFETVRGHMLPRRHIGWPAFYTYSAEALNATGQHERAKALLEEALEHVRPEDRSFVALYLPLERELAMTQAGLGNIDAAVEQLEALRAEHEQHRGPVTCGSLHEARAKVAILVGDGPAFQEHFEKMGEYYRATLHPCLIDRCERLGRVAAAGSSPRRTLAPTSTVEATVAEPWRVGASVSSSAGFTTSLAKVLSGAASTEERAARVLEFLLSHHDCAEGFLFLVDGDRVRLGAAVSCSSPPPELWQRAHDVLAACRDDQPTELIDEQSAGNAASDDGQDDYETAVLAVMKGGQPNAIGVVAMNRSGAEARPPDYELLRAIAEHLVDQRPWQTAASSGVKASPGCSSSK